MSRRSFHILGQLMIEFGESLSPWITPATINNGARPLPNGQGPFPTQKFHMIRSRISR